MFKGMFEDKDKVGCEWLGAKKIPKGWHDYRKKTQQNIQPGMGEIKTPNTTRMLQRSDI